MDERGNLSEAEKEKLIKHLELVWKESKCQGCGQNDWVVGDLAGTILGRSGSATLIGPYYPVLVIICQNCGQMVFMNAYVAGLEMTKEGPTRTDAQQVKPEEPKPEQRDA